MSEAHAASLEAAAADGRLFDLWFTSTSALHAGGGPSYVAAALTGQREGHMLPWVVRELDSGDIVGSTRFHDIVAAIDRVEIGFTFYAARWQRTRRRTASCGTIRRGATAVHAIR